MLTGESPFRAATASAALRRVATEDPPAPSRVTGAAELASLDRLVERMLAKRPEDRFPDMNACAATMDALIGHVVAASPIVPAVVIPRAVVSAFAETVEVAAASAPAGDPSPTVTSSLRPVVVRADPPPAVTSEPPARRRHGRALALISVAVLAAACTWAMRRHDASAMAHAAEPGDSSADASRHPPHRTQSFSEIKQVAVDVLDGRVPMAPSAHSPGATPRPGSRRADVAFLRPLDVDAVDLPPDPVTPSAVDAEVKKRLERRRDEKTTHRERPATRPAPPSPVPLASDPAEATSRSSRRPRSGPRR
jgi:hypothetical protein